jgi:hypothetical protein
MRARVVATDTTIIVRLTVNRTRGSLMTRASGS